MNKTIFRFHIGKSHFDVEGENVKAAAKSLANFSLELINKHLENRHQKELAQNQLIKDILTSDKLEDDISKVFISSAELIKSLKNK